MMKTEADRIRDWAKNCAELDRIEVSQLRPWQDLPRRNAPPANSLAEELFRRNVRITVLAYVLCFSGEGGIDPDYLPRMIGSPKGETRLLMQIYGLHHNLAFKCTAEAWNSGRVYLEAVLEILQNHISAKSISILNRLNELAPLSLVTIAPAALGGRNNAEALAPRLETVLPTEDARLLAQKLRKAGPYENIRWNRDFRFNEVFPVLKAILPEVDKPDQRLASLHRLYCQRLGIDEKIMDQKTFRNWLEEFRGWQKGNH